MTVARRSALLIAASAFLPMASAIAADYDPPVIEAAEEYVPVEVGSGWYLRGDIGYIFDKGYGDTQLAIVDGFADFAPFPPIQVSSWEEDDNAVLGSIGFGYHFNDYLRADVNLGLLPDEESSASGVLLGGCIGAVCGAELNAKNTYWTGLVNAYVDLGTFAGFTPYVGGGVGVLYSKTELSAVGNRMEVNYSDRDYNFLYSLNAGVSYAVAENTSIDLGYQYMSAPDAPFVKVSDNGAEFSEGIDQHQVRLGLRYDLW